MDNYVSSITENKILKIRLERSHKKNALTEKMYLELGNLINNSSKNPDINVILICGGDDFTAGNDLNDFIQNPPTDANSPVFQFMLALTNSPLPIVAAVDGFAVGIGTTMLLHCDLVYASKSSIFMLPFINLGLVPEFASSQLLEKRTGYLKAAEMLMLGNKFDAKTAFEYRLINQICESEELLRLAVDSAEKLATKPRESLIITKSLMRRESESITDRIKFEAQHFIEFLNKSSTKEIINKLGKK